MLESTIESCTVQRAESKGWWHRKAVWLGRRGAPDHLFAKDGKLIFVEFKKLGKTPDKLQKKEHQKLRDHGFDTYIIDTLEAGYALFE